MLVALVLTFWLCKPAPHCSTLNVFRAVDYRRPRQHKGSEVFPVSTIAARLELLAARLELLVGSFLRLGGCVLPSTWLVDWPRLAAPPAFEL